MLKVGVIGHGGMGRYHAGVYAAREDVELVAVCDKDPQRLKPNKDVAINLGTGSGADVGSVRTFTDAEEMLATAELDLVSVCTPTDLHAELSIAAMRAGVHVLCEKPMARHLHEADEMLAVCQQTGRTLMVGQCIRFWPFYEALADACRSGQYGELLILSLRRVSATPRWSSDDWMRQAPRSGGCLLDMHLHDTDFVCHALGLPQAVATAGRVGPSGGIDTSVTHYLYPDGPVVMAEATWGYTGGFNMSFWAQCQRACLEMDYREGRLVRREGGAGEAVAVDVPEGSGVEREIDYLLGCLRDGRPTDRCTPASTRQSLAVVLAEQRSAQAGGARVQL